MGGGNLRLNFLAFWDSVERLTDNRGVQLQHQLEYKELTDARELEQLCGAGSV